MVSMQKKHSAHSKASSRKSLLAASLLCAGLTLPVVSNAQDSIAMIDTGAIAKVSTAAATINTVTAVEPIADAQVPIATESNKSPITGLEPGTLALIGFGLIALAATRRNAR